MSKGISRRAAAFGLLSLAGCGFAPILGESAVLRGRISFETPETVAGFRLRAQLENRLGPAADAPYLLTVRLTSQQSQAAVSAEGDTTRFNIVGSASWKLLDRGTGDLIETGKVEGFASYATTGSTVATQAAESDAIARLSVQLADMIVSRLLVLSPKLAA